MARWCETRRCGALAAPRRWRVALLLASDEAAYMTGSELNLDGGLLAGSAVTPATAEAPSPTPP